MRLPLRCSFYLLVVLGLCGFMRALAQGGGRFSTTAWKDGHFAVDAAGLLGRSDIVLGEPNTKPGEAMPMGNGRLGIAVWAADGFNAQLNRADTLPHRDSPGQLVIPSLSKLTGAKDFSGRLDLYNGSLVEHGGGISLTAYVQVSTDTFVVDVTGADPNRTQTATLRLWEPRKPNASAANRVGMLEQTWIDHYGPEASGETFGALAAITATGRDVSVAVSSPRSVTISFKPAQDGHFRVTVASPQYNGGKDQLAAINSALANSDPQEHIA